jgi:hypothetical protein
MKRSQQFYSIALGALATFAAWAAAQAHSATPQERPREEYIAELRAGIAGREQQPSEQVWKNLQLLKGMPAVRVLAIMQVAFSDGLAVNCTHCHVAGEWEKDDKEPKLVARKMWTMQRELRQKLGEIRAGALVNCYTCHRGQTKPALAPPQS